MRIVIFGAGAIGSLFGGLLSRTNDVLLIGRKNHVDAIKRNGLKISGKTNLKDKVKASISSEKIDFIPDLLILTVKSYDTKKAIQQAKKLIDKNTLFLSLQNGLDNIQKIQNHVKKDKIMTAVTTEGAVFSKPGKIIHAGVGETKIGGIKDDNEKKVTELVRIFNNSGIPSKSSKNIEKEIWKKAVINSSINPLTAFFNCKNGYLLRNPILKKIVEKTCLESTQVARSQEMMLNPDEMLNETKSVINKTAENFSSMLQSVKKNKKTEIDSINGQMVFKGDNEGLDISLNKILLDLIKNI